MCPQGTRSKNAEREPPRNKMLSTAALVLITTVIVWAETPLPPGEDGGESDVTLYLVDPDGQPVAGAQVGFLVLLLFS